MAQQFTLTLVNPAAPSPQNEIYTGLAGGNKLNLIVTNNSGFSTEFGGSSSGNLLVKFPKNIVDAASLEAVTVASPWTTDGIFTPDDDPDPKDGKNYFVLKLKLPDGQTVSFDDGASVTVSLASLSPTEKGNATVFAAYTFSDLGPMNVSSQLTVLASSKPDNKPLLGDSNALRLTVKVNDGPASNPIVVTKSPVTPGNAAENTMQLNFDFQDQNLPKGTGGGQTLGQLVPSWDPKNPPTFRIQFPYFTAQSPFAAPLDLTDNVAAGDPDYNAYTSARNIKLSLSKTNPDILQNDWWTIALDPLSPVPSWLVQPTTVNKYLFTGTTSGPNASGPFLDLFFSHIYSALPIDPTRPETILYVETYNFPGFNDRLQQQPVFKEPSVQIVDFYGRLAISGGVTTLYLSWHTNADYCLVSGDSNKQGKNSDEDYSKPIGLAKKLMSTYTLTAYGTDGVSKIEKTIAVQWKESPSKSVTSFQYPTAIDVSPDANSVYVAGNDALNVLAASTLLELAGPLKPARGAVRNVIATADGTRLFLALMSSEGDGFIKGYTSTLQPLQIPEPNPGFNNSPNLYPMALGGDGSQLVISAPYPEGQDAQFIAGYDTSTLAKSPAAEAKVPSLRQIGLAIKGNTVYYPDKNGLGMLDRASLKPLPGSPISLKSADNVSYTPGPLAVSPAGNSVATLALGFIADKRVFILCLVDIPSARVKRVQVYTGFANAAPVSTTGMAFSLDGKYLFVFGTDYSKTPPDINSTIFNVFDAATLQEFPWSPIKVSKFYGDFAMAPDGSRIYVSTLDTGMADRGPVAQLIPYFPQH